ncbi:MAG: TIGR02452 family protein [Synergistaceae bacterium]|nr:TIGR02452 family protein [Synergistaceae bacterium]
MKPTREQLAEVFRDTLKFIENDTILSRASADTNRRTKVYPADFAEEVDTVKAGKVDVISGRTLQTALDLHGKFPDKKIAVLNFAASQHPGGGVENGSLAQEESICRSSTLYPSLKTQKAREGFYSFHYEGGFGWRASDTCIYSPDVVIFRDDDDYIPARLSPEEFVKIDVVTCAAPHVFMNVEISDEDLYAMNLSRAKNILRVCAYNGVDIFVTGAFGCGAFKNPAKLVAHAWREALKDYGKKFDLVVFAIYAGLEKEKHTINIFREELSPIM